MSKRMNPQRRLLAYQMALRRSLVVYGNSEDAGKLQEGPVRSHTNGFAAKVAIGREPNWTPEDAQPRCGKIVKGEFKANYGQKGRFSTK